MALPEIEFEEIQLRLKQMIAELADIPINSITGETVVAGKSPAGEVPLLDSLDCLKLSLMVAEEFPTAPPWENLHDPIDITAITTLLAGDQ